MERVLIIEDEPLAAEKLRMLMQRIRPSLTVVAVLTTVEDSIRWLSVHTADLIFLDINLADGISFKIFEHVEVDTPIIFTTAYDEYAIRAFRQNSLDYILKPVTEEELAASLKKYNSYYGRHENDAPRLKALLSHYLPETHYRSRILITYGSKSKSVDTKAVAYLYAFEKGVYLATFDAQTFLTDDSLDSLEQTLDPRVFFRINRKYLVNARAIQEIHKYSTRRLKIALVPPTRFDAIVPAEKITPFKQWLNA